MPAISRIDATLRIKRELRFALTKSTSGPQENGDCRSTGYGRDLGAAALEQYTETKCVWVGLE